MPGRVGSGRRGRFITYNDCMVKNKDFLFNKQYRKKTIVSEILPSFIFEKQNDQCGWKHFSQIEIPKNLKTNFKGIKTRMISELGYLLCMHHSDLNESSSFV